MKALYFLTILFCSVIFIGCKTDKTTPTEETKPALGKYFFDFDEVIYYGANDGNPNPDAIWKEKNKSKKDTMTIELMQRYLPEKVSDTISIAYYDSIGFTKKIIPMQKHKQIREIFREKHVDNPEFAGCAWTFRDIYVFKKQGKVTGVAKLCYDCGISHFIGTTANCEAFGYYGEYKELRDLMK